MPPVALIIFQAIQAAITEAPEIAAIVTKGKEFISSLTAGGIISVQQQNDLHARIDAHCEAVLKGEYAPWWNDQPE